MTSLCKNGHALIPEVVYRRKYPEKIRQNNRTRHSRFKDSLGHYSSWMERYYRFIQNGCCMYCGLPISNTVGVYADDRETLEHIIPLSRGGLHCWSNTSLSCRKCNLQKGSKTSTEFSGDKDGR